jgi:ABC-type antimicrobial peptide transport system permease subunit
MSANLYQQSKEIAVLRAIGLKKNKIKLLYFYEAIILIFASCLLGIMIGVTVGYTMVAQQSMLLHQPMSFFFPYV